MGSKCHAADVYSCIAKILPEDRLDESCKALLAFDIAQSALSALSENFGMIMNPSYDMDDCIGDITDRLINIIEAAKPVLPIEKKVEMERILEKLATTLAEYGLGDDYSTKEEGGTAMRTALKNLRDEDVPSDEEDGEEDTDGIASLDGKVAAKEDAPQAICDDEAPAEINDVASLDVKGPVIDLFCYGLL